MNLGMLWFDNDPEKEINLKVQEAAAYYQKKYGGQPNIAFVHPDTIGDGLEVPGVSVEGSTSIMNNHVWIGVDDDNHNHR